MEEEREDVFYSPDPHFVNEKSDADDDEEEEIQRLSIIMRSILETQYPSSKGIDDTTLRRFLRARDMNVEKAATMLGKYLAWRQTFVPKGLIAASEVSNEILQNKVFTQGKDKQGRPIAVVFGSKHFPRKGGVDELKRFTVFVLDKLCSRTDVVYKTMHNHYSSLKIRMTEEQEKFTVISDLQGYGYCNSDVRGSLASLSILQDYYPERLGKVFNINVPSVFMALWKIVYPFIDKNTRKKIVFVEKKQLQATLLEDIDESQLPEIYGGKLQLVPIHDS